MQQLSNVSLTVEPSVLDNKKRCIVCGEWFKRAPHKPLAKWAKQRLCSIKCRAFHFGYCAELRHRVAKQWTYECGVCGKKLTGNKNDLKRHKYDIHGH